MEEQLPAILPQQESPTQQAFRQSVHQDVDMLITDFLTQRQKNFATFKDVWTRLDFILIHVSKSDEFTYAWFMDCLFDECLELVIEMLEVNKEGVLGAVFLLFSLHQTQAGNARISVSKRSWSRLVAFDKICLENAQLAEGHKVLGMLVAQHAFNFVAMTPREIMEAHRQYSEFLAETQGSSGDLMLQAENDLANLARDVIGAPPSLISNAYDLYNKEHEYLEKRTAAAGSVPPVGIAKDLSQTQRDWSSTFGSIDSTVKHSSINFRGGGGSQGGAKGRRATVHEPLQRPQTAPPPATEPPEYMISAEHMPSLF